MWWWLRAPVPMCMRGSAMAEGRAGMVMPPCDLAWVLTGCLSALRCSVPQVILELDDIETGLGLPLTPLPDALSNL